MTKLFKKSDNIENEVSSLFQELLGVNVSLDEEPASTREQSPLTLTGTYKIPVRVGKTGNSLEEGDKPWIVGHFIPNQYINESHLRGHNGVDLKASKGTSIYALGPGTVIQTGVGEKSGNYAKIEHENGQMTSFYAHMDSLKVQKGQEVNENSVVGTVGDTGNAKGTGGTRSDGVPLGHLHLEVKVKGSLVDPFSIFGKEVGFMSKKAEEDFIEIFNKFAEDRMEELLEEQEVELSPIQAALLAAPRRRNTGLLEMIVAEYLGPDSSDDPADIVKSANGSGKKIADLIKRSK